MSVAAMSPDETQMGGRREWTEEQRRAIERRSGDLLLDAGAGSGKTSVLVERFVRAVLEDGIAVSAILTITFTEKAAAELRDRIRARLRALGADEAARATEGAFISTIHGFCARVLRAHALAAGLDPDFRVLDRYESDPLAAAAFETALTELAAARPAAVDLIAAYGTGSLRAAVVSVHGQLRSAGARTPALPVVTVDAAAAGASAASLARTAAEVAAELGALDAPSAKCAEALERAQQAEAVAAAGPAAAWPADLYRLKLPRSGAALSTDACVAYGEALDAFREASATAAAVPVRDLLDGLLSGYGAEYERRKRAVSGLDFEDLELHCRDLLAGDPELRERYAARFEQIMVDELQDTNAVQLALIESIARDNLFTVGDAQQSIYGFRHADVGLFVGRGARLHAVGARETLRTNFRSRPEILDALNRAFANELGDAFMALRPGREPAGNAEPAVELLAVDKGVDWELEGMAAPWRLAEARTLAGRVAELVAEGTAPGELVVLMRATTDMRAYERALETRGLPTYVIGGRGYWAHPQVVDMVAYLRALANPRDEEALYGVLASPLVGLSYDGLVLLAAAARASRHDPWWVIREPETATVALAPALAELTPDDRGALARFAEWFAAERARAARASIEELIDGALSATGYDLAMLAMPGGRRRLANVRKLMRLGREHEASNGPDLRGFLGLLADREAGRSPEQREGEAPVEGEGLDAIRLMTIHRAKGLEFPVVCVADLGRSPRPPSEIVRVSADGRLGIRLIRAGAGGRENALAYRELGEESRAAAEAEERRLFYVAMTRARERLLLSGAARFEEWLDPTKRARGGPIAWIAPAFVPELHAVIAAGGGEVEAEGTRVLVRLGRPEDVCEVAAEHAPPGDPAASPVVARPGGSVAPVAPVAAPPPAPPVAALSTAPVPAGPPVATLSYSSLGEYARCGYRFYAERVLGLPPVEGEGVPGAPEGAARAPGQRTAPGQRSAADRGVLAHALLERLDFRRPVPPPADTILAAAARAGLTPAPGPEECDELIALVRRFACTELCARLGRATQVRREERFGFPLDGVLVVGALDVLAREPPARALIVDYKSDRLGAAAPADAVARGYVTQQLIYALAALRGGAREVEVVHCFLEAPEQPVVATFAGGDAEELEARLRRLASGVVARRFEVTPAPCRTTCAGCPAEGGLCSWPLAQTRRESADTLF
jgi:ATP-dependent exoDNAse (exonuclease V) beta subunit